MKIIATVLAVLMVCTASMAQEKSEKEFPRCFLNAFNFRDTFFSRGFSMGVSGGAGISPDSEVSPNTDGIWTGDDGAYGGRIFAAYEHTPCLAVEASVGGFRRAERIDSRPEAMLSLQLGVVAKIYLGDRFSIFARGGAHRWNLDGDELEIENMERVRFIEEDGIDPFYGVGAEISTSTGAWRFGISGTRYEHSYQANVFRYGPVPHNPANRAYNLALLEDGSHTDVIEFAVTRFWGGGN